MCLVDLNRLWHSLQRGVQYTHKYLKPKSCQQRVSDRIRHKCWAASDEYVMQEVGADPRHLLISHQVLFMQRTPSVWCLHVAAEQRAGLALHSETDPLLTCTHAASQNSHVAACIPHCTLKFCRVPRACAFHGDNRWRLTVIHMLISGFMRQGCQYKTCNKLPAFTLSHWRQ